MTGDRKQAKRRRLGLSAQVMIALIVGTLAGVFFGEMVGWLDVVGRVFIRLLKMTVLPYVVVSLITSLGQLTFAQAGALARRSGLILLVLWVVSLGFVLVMPLAFPDWERAGFFSAAAIDAGPPPSFVEVFVPDNPFHSLANSVVPAVVLFSVAVGVALIGVRNKRPFLDAMSSLSDAITAITKFVIRLAPYGVFAIVASAAGTMSVKDLSRLQVYAVAYVVLALVLAFWALPALVTTLTSLRYRDVLGPTRDALVMAFATGNVFVVLPVLAEETKELLAGSDLDEQEAGTVLDVVVPASYNFPKAGNVLVLSFVLFAGWFTDHDVPLTQYGVFAVSGIVSIFGGANAAVPFMLDVARIPADTFGLFVALNNIVLLYFGALLSAIHIIALSILTVCAMSGRLVLRWARIVRYVVVTVVLAGVAVAGVRVFFERVVPAEYQGYRAFLEMELTTPPVETVVHETPPPPLPDRPDRSRLEEILGRGRLRLCHHGDELPFAFANSAGELVGMDVDLGRILARELGVGLELVQLDGTKPGPPLSSGVCDLVASVAITTERALQVTFSEPYMNGTLAFIVPDHRRNEFDSRAEVQRLERLRLAAPDVPYYVEKARRYLPRAEIVIIDSPREYFENGEPPGFDALLFTAEAGSAWTLVYPEFSVAIPLPDVLSLPVAFALPLDEPQFVDFVNAWLELKRQDGTLDDLHAHWILGEGAESHEPRWSIVRNVLGWVD